MTRLVVMEECIDARRLLGVAVTVHKSLLYQLNVKYNDGVRETELRIPSPLGTRSFSALNGTQISLHPLWGVGTSLYSAYFPQILRNSRHFHCYSNRSESELHLHWHNCELQMHLEIFFSLVLNKLSLYVLPFPLSLTVVRSSVNAVGYPISCPVR